MGLLRFETINRALDAQDAPIAGAHRFVYRTGTSTLTRLFRDPGLSQMQANPMVSGSDGSFDLCFVVDGSYRVVIEDPNGKIIRDYDGISVGSALEFEIEHQFPDIAALTADTVLGYSNGFGRYRVAAGHLIQVTHGDLTFEVAPEGASDGHLTSGGGVVFYEAGNVFSTLDRFRDALARGASHYAGATVFAAGTGYHFADDGNTDIPGLTGWEEATGGGGVSGDVEARLSQAESDAALALQASVGAIYASPAEGIAATSNDEIFVVAVEPGTAVYRNDSGTALRIGWLSETIFDDEAALLASTIEIDPATVLRTRRGDQVFEVAPTSATDAYATTAGGVKLYEAGPYSSVERMARSQGLDGEVRIVRGEARDGIFVWTPGNLRNEVERDPMGGVYVPPADVPDGGSGCWRRLHKGVIHAEWFGATGEGDDTDAVQGCDEFLREFPEAVAWEVTKVHTTLGFGDLITKETFADFATATANLGGLSEYDVVRVTVDETDNNVDNRYRVRSGGLVRLSRGAYNGKTITGPAAAKRNGFVLAEGAPAWMRLFAASFQDGGVENIIFNGNNPSNQWGSGSVPQRNPLTQLLVEIEGYGISWRNVVVRHSGGDGIKFRGIIGNIEISGGDCVSQYNIGWGWVIDRISSLKASKLWAEGNIAGDILFKHDIAPGDPDIGTGTTYFKESNVEIDSIYTENASNDAVVVQVEGGHLGPRIGQMALHGSSTNRTLVYLKDGADASGIYQGCTGGVFELGNLLDAKIIIESQSRNNVFFRNGGLWSSVENDAWDFRDAGRDNVVLWKAPDAAAFVPGSEPGDITVNKGSSNFVNNSGASAQLTNAPGGILGPIQDYHSNFAAAPSFAKATGFNPTDGGSEANVLLSVNAQIPAVAQTWYCIVLGQFEAHQLVQIGVKDHSANEFYNWNSKTWTSIGAADDFGIYRVLRADRTALSYALAFDNDATAREIRIQVRLKGAGEADLYHAYVTDQPRPALTGIRAGTFLGTAINPVCITARLPDPTAVPVGTRVYNTTTSQVEVNDGAAWVAV